MRGRGILGRRDASDAVQDFFFDGRAGMLEWQVAYAWISIEVFIGEADSSGQARSVAADFVKKSMDAMEELAPMSPAVPINNAEWEYRLRSLNREERFQRAEDTHSRRLFCIMLTLMILCGAAVLVAVIVAAFIFIAQN